MSGVCTSGVSVMATSGFEGIDVSPFVGISGVECTGVSLEIVGLLREHLEGKYIDKLKLYLGAGGFIRPYVIDDASACVWRDGSVSLSVPEQLADGLMKWKDIIKMKNSLGLIYRRNCMTDLTPIFGSTFLRNGLRSGIVLGAWIEGGGGEAGATMGGGGGDVGAGSEGGGDGAATGIEGGGSDGETGIEVDVDDWIVGRETGEGDCASCVSTTFDIDSKNKYLTETT